RPESHIDHAALTEILMGTPTNSGTPTNRFPTDALINGQWVTSGATFPVYDPATGHEIARVPNLGIREATEAIDAAEEALPSWSAMTAKERGAILRRWFDLI